MPASLNSCASPSCILSSLTTAISKQSCWPPTRRKTLAWHFHSQIICLLLKIYAIACNRNGPAPEHLGLPPQSSDLWSGPGPAPAADTTGFIFSPEPAVGLDQWTFWVCQHSQLCSAETSEPGMKAWVLARALLLQMWLLIHIPLMTQGERSPLVCAVVR